MPPAGEGYTRTSAAESARGGLVCLLDADLQYRPEDIGLLLGMLHSEKATLVQGARRWAERMRATRYAVSRATSALLHGLFGLRTKGSPASTAQYRAVTKKGPPL